MYFFLKLDLFFLVSHETLIILERAARKTHPRASLCIWDNYIKFIQKCWKYTTLSIWVVNFFHSSPLKSSENQRFSNDFRWDSDQYSYTVCYTDAEDVYKILNRDNQIQSLILKWNFTFIQLKKYFLNNILSQLSSWNFSSELQKTQKVSMHAADLKSTNATSVSAKKIILNFKKAFFSESFLLVVRVRHLKVFNF